MVSVTGSKSSHCGLAPTGAVANAAAEALVAGALVVGARVVGVCEVLGAEELHPAANSPSVASVARRKEPGLSSDLVIFARSLSAQLMAALLRRSACGERQAGRRSHRPPAPGLATIG